MPRVGFEPMFPVFEQEKVVYALERAATVVGSESITSQKIQPHDNFTCNENKTVTICK
jgi:hypothetical protein